jgi:hypothetical protein
MPKQDWHVFKISKITWKCVVRQFSSRLPLRPWTALRKVVALAPTNARQAFLWALHQYFRDCRARSFWKTRLGTVSLAGRKCNKEKRDKLAIWMRWNGGCALVTRKLPKSIFIRIPPFFGILQNGMHGICPATSRGFMIKPLRTTFQGGSNKSIPTLNFTRTTWTLSQYFYFSEDQKSSLVQSAYSQGQALTA